MYPDRLIRAIRVAAEAAGWVWQGDNCSQSTDSVYLSFTRPGLYRDDNVFSPADGVPKVLTIRLASHPAVSQNGVRLGAYNHTVSPDAPDAVTQAIRVLETQP